MNTVDVVFYNMYHDLHYHHHHHHHHHHIIFLHICHSLVSPPFPQKCSPSISTKQSNQPRQYVGSIQLGWSSSFCIPSWKLQKSFMATLSRGMPLFVSRGVEFVSGSGLMEMLRRCGTCGGLSILICFFCFVFFCVFLGGSKNKAR